MEKLNMQTRVPGDWDLARDWSVLLQPLEQLAPTIGVTHSNHWSNLLQPLE